jgi:hypothetical protein
MHRRATAKPDILHAGEHLAGEDLSVKASAASTDAVILFIDSETP